jgi:NodT family efflux transporter outer membrane factor (OMF) lipoprotein
MTAMRNALVCSQKMPTPVAYSLGHGLLTLALAVGLAMGLAMGLAGCASTTPSEPKAADVVGVPVNFKEAALFKPAQSAPAAPDTWWTLFDDAVLNALQADLLVGNETLKSNLAAYRLAQATLAGSRAATLPTLGAGLSASRSANPPAQVASNSYNLSAAASWELDLWGRLAGAVDSNQARLVASAADLAAAKLSLHTTLAQSYFSMRNAEAQAQAVQTAVIAYERSLVLTQNRYSAGIASSADVAQAQTQLKSAQVQLLEFQTTRAQLEHAIAALLGKAPASLDVARTAMLPAAPSAPLQLPSTLLERRPDIYAARQRVVAAYAQIGVAQAAFFPTLTLNANAGFRNSNLANLISAPNRLWSLGPQLALAAFDGGARQAATESARASAEQAVSLYRQTVLTALQEVEDNLVAAANLEEEISLQAQALVAAERSLNVVTNQYLAGTVSYLSVVIAQTTALSSQQTLLNVRNRRLAAINLLLKNLAGRWDGQALATR